MTKEYINKLLDLYGLERILEDNQTSVPEILEILEDLGYVHLDHYPCVDVDPTIFNCD